MTRGPLNMLGSVAHYLFRLLVCGVVAISLLACTTMQSIQPIQSRHLHATIRVGDHVRLITKNGTTYDLVVTALDGTSAQGVDPSGQARTVLYAQIVRLEVEKMDATKVTLWVLFGVLATIGIGAFLVSHALD